MTELERTYRRWKTLVERGYGRRDNTAEHMRRVDAAIRKAKEKYEAAFEARATKED